MGQSDESDLSSDFGSDDKDFNANKLEIVEEKPKEEEPLPEQAEG